VAGRAGGADPLADLTDQDISQLLLPAVTGEAHIDRGLDVAADRLAVDADQAVDRPIALTQRPQPQHLFDLEHGYLPVGHGHPSSG